MRSLRWYWFLLKWEFHHGKTQRRRWRIWEERFKGLAPYTPEELRALIVEVNRKDNESCRP